MTDTWSRHSPCEHVFLNMLHNPSHTHSSYFVFIVFILHKSADCCMKLLKLKMVLYSICLPFHSPAPPTPPASSYVFYVCAMLAHGRFALPVHNFPQRHVEVRGSWTDLVLECFPVGLKTAASSQFDVVLIDRN